MTDDDRNVLHTILNHTKEIGALQASVTGLVGNLERYSNLMGAESRDMRNTIVGDLREHRKFVEKEREVLLSEMREVKASLTGRRTEHLVLIGTSIALLALVVTLISQTVVALNRETAVVYLPAPPPAAPPMVQPAPPQSVPAPVPHPPAQTPPQP